MEFVQLDNRPKRKYGALIAKGQNVAQHDADFSAAGYIVEICVGGTAPPHVAHRSLTPCALCLIRNLIDDVEFYCVDAGRANLEFLARLVETVIAVHMTIKNVLSAAGRNAKMHCTAITHLIVSSEHQYFL